MECLHVALRQPNYDVSALINNEVTNSDSRSVCCDRFFTCFCTVLVRRIQVYSTKPIAVDTKTVSCIQHLIPCNNFHGTSVLARYFA
jgi:hypothetical protein